jgi:hypothetical protein
VGLWDYPRLVFFGEYLFFAAVVLTTAEPPRWVGVLGEGLLLHALDANSFFGFTRSNPFGTPARFAIVTLAGYLGAIVWFISAWR